MSLPASLPIAIAAACCEVAPAVCPIASAFASVLLNVPALGPIPILLLENLTCPCENVIVSGTVSNAIVPPEKLIAVPPVICDLT